MFSEVDHIGKFFIAHGAFKSLSLCFAVKLLVYFLSHTVAKNVPPTMAGVLWHDFLNHTSSDFVYHTYCTHTSSISR